MEEKREYKRYRCNVEINFKFYEGNPDEMDVETSTPLKGKGFMLDIGRGGAFIVSNSRVSVKMPVKLNFKVKKTKYSIYGFVSRTGFIKNNPDEIVRRYKAYEGKADIYIGIKFDTLISEDIVMGINS